MDKTITQAESRTVQIELQRLSILQESGRGNVRVDLGSEQSPVRIWKWNGKASSLSFTQGLAHQRNPENAC